MIDIKRSPRVVLFLYLLLATALLSCAAFALIHLNQANRLPAKQDVDVMAAVMQSVIAIAVAFTAALATIYLAVLGINIVEEQTSRDIANRSLEFVTAAYRPLLFFVMAIEEVLDASEYLYLRLSEVRNQGIDQGVSPETLKDVFSPVVTAYGPAVLKGIDVLQDAIVKLWECPEAIALIRANIFESRYNAMTRRVHPNWDEQWHPSNGPQAPLSMLNGIRIHMTNLIENPKSDFWTVAFIVFINCFDRRGKSINQPQEEFLTRHWNFFFATYLLTENLDEAGVLSGADPLNFGAAIFLDLLQSVPSTDVTEALVASYFHRGKRLGSGPPLPNVVSSYILAASPARLMRANLGRLIETRSELGLIGIGLGKKPTPD